MAIEIKNISFNIIWEGPIVNDLNILPDDKRGVYCICSKIDKSKYGIVKYGSSAPISRIVGRYKKAFSQIPNLTVFYISIDDEFKNIMAEFLKNYYKETPNHKYLNDRDWLEYRIETILIDQYLEKFGKRPPANFQSGSKRPYLKFLNLTESGDFISLNFEPAEIGELALLFKNKNSKKRKSNGFLQ